MATNRAHRDTKEVIEHFMRGNPEGAVTLLIGSIDKYLNNEIEITIDQDPPQTSLLFMGVHAAALTISEVLFRKKGKEGYKQFLKEFIDGKPKHHKFSTITSELHIWRNTLVHGWLSKHGINIEYEYDMPKGFEKRRHDLYINPRVYLELYLQAFQNSGRIWEYIKNMSGEDLNKAQKIIIQKFLR